MNALADKQRPPGGGGEAAVTKQKQVKCKSWITEYLVLHKLIPLRQLSAAAGPGCDHGRPLGPLVTTNG
jgi:hypothetical protein